MEQLTQESIGTINLESKEREYEGGEDYQFTSLGTLQQFAEEHNRNGVGTSWSINPMPETPDEMELLIWTNGQPKPEHA